MLIYCIYFILVFVQNLRVYEEICFSQSAISSQIFVERGANTWHSEVRTPYGLNGISIQMKYHIEVIRGNRNNN